MKINLNIYLTTITVFCFLQITSQNSTKNDFKKMSNADLILKYYGDTLLRSNCVRYAAVVKNSSSKFEIEIGVNEYNCINLSDSIPDCDILTRNFPANIIPTSFPIPNNWNISKCNNLNKIDVTKKNNYRVKSKRIEITKKLSNQFYSNRNENIDNEFIKPKEKTKTQLLNYVPSISLRDWVYKKPSNHSIRIKDGDLGSLGAIFELQEYPDELFGITNWHVLNGKLNDTVFSSNDYPIGNIFWTAKNSLFEAAFVRFNTKTKILFKQKYNQVIPKFLIKKEITFTDYGHHHGAGSDKDRFAKVFSNNAHVKVFSDLFTPRNRIFKKQILFNNLSKKGDSGTILRSLNVSEILNPNIKCLGLIIADNYSITLKDKKKQLLTVSNNLTNIFDIVFDNQEYIFDPLKGKTPVYIFKLKK